MQQRSANQDEIDGYIEIGDVNSYIEASPGIPSGVTRKAAYIQNQIDILSGLDDELYDIVMKLEQEKSSVSQDKLKVEAKRLDDEMIDLRSKIFDELSGLKI